MTPDATTRCAVVGGGPGGVLLAYLLARGGVPVTLLESRSDFDRRFRGDAIAPPVLDLLDVLGLADPLLAAVPHTIADAFVWSTPTHRYRLADYSRASAKYPYYALVPQGRLLPFLVERAGEFDGFRVEMGARVAELLHDGPGRDGPGQSPGDLPRRGLRQADRARHRLPGQAWDGNAAQPRADRRSPSCCATAQDATPRSASPASRTPGTATVARCTPTWSSGRTGATRRCASCPGARRPSWARTSTSAGTRCRAARPTRRCRGWS